ncbi:MAG: FAD-dependent oxidoreductase [Rhodospirillaceae bacterium]|nr:FAD-dependent oxidoreductase [Rhodospirillaceae bacterium]MBT5879268.1 FAD-dependent oxidoreductase [Rhodospirillaceae bacterium]MBT6982729.1 FAD-dependent oxidoreductase [Rhodospirillaceae bacterium]
MGIITVSDKSFEMAAPVLIIGAGACGCCAALAVKEAGREVLVLERDAAPSGSTSLSGGQVLGAGTALQRAAGIEDTADLLANDLIVKAKQQNDAAMARHIAAQSARTVDWLVETHGVPLASQQAFRYPGHSAQHMHATPQKSGAELLVCLHNAVAAAGIDVVLSAHVTDLFTEADGRVVGVRLSRPDGSVEEIGCDALILACNGYGGNPEMLQRYIPDIAQAHYHGHVGNQGDAVNWGLELGAAISDMGSFQGYGAVITPVMIHLAWVCITEGGIQVNVSGERFSHENTGYSEQALHVIGQPEGVAWTIFDQRGQDIAMDLIYHREAMEIGAIRQVDTIAEIAEIVGCDSGTLAATMEDVAAMGRGEKTDAFGRDFTTKPPLQAPYYVAKITGALFHTQGGLDVDLDGRVLRPDGTALVNLFAGGGAARGLSGPADWGYLSGSGLLMATTLGRLAGTAAAAMTAMTAD